MNFEIRSIPRTTCDVGVAGRKSASLGGDASFGITTCGTPLGSGGSISPPPALSYSSAGPAGCPLLPGGRAACTDGTANDSKRNKRNRCPGSPPLLPVPVPRGLWYPNCRIASSCPGHDGVSTTPIPELRSASILPVREAHRNKPRTLLGNVSTILQKAPIDSSGPARNTRFAPGSASAPRPSFKALPPSLSG